jgi:hypothetical protein
MLVPWGYYYMATYSNKCIIIIIIIILIIDWDTDNSLTLILYYSQES